jgi:hypothetical protein
MEARRAGMWDRLTGVAGFVVLVALFLPFYYTNEDTFSAWAAFALIDKVILLSALLALALPLVAMLKSTPSAPQKLALATLAFGAIALLGTVVRLFNHAKVVSVDTPISLRFGAFLLVVGLVAMVAGALLAMRERKAHRVAPQRVATTT